MSKTNENSGGFWVVVAIVLGLAMVLGQFKNNDASAPTTSPNQDTFEHRYVRERFRQEGFSSSEAQQAADAVIRFHEAQQRKTK